MNLNYYKECIDAIDELVVIGRETTINNVVCNVAGLMRTGPVASLVLVTYDSQYRELREMYETAERMDRKITHRIDMRENIKFTKNNIGDDVEKIMIGEQEFTSSMSSSAVLSGTDAIVTVCKFISKGWNLQSIGCYDTENLYIEIIELEEAIDSLVSLDTGKIELIKRNGRKDVLIEKKIKLTVGEQNKKVTVREKDSEQTYTAFINSVTLFDPWEETEKRLNDPEFLKLVPEDELPQIKKNMEEANANLCPKGMRLPVVEYECEDLSLQFYLREYLDSEPTYTGDGPTAIIMMRSDHDIGKHGLKMRCCCMQSPVSPDTTEINVEIFSGCIMTEGCAYML